MRLGEIYCFAKGHFNKAFSCYSDTLLNQHAALQINIMYPVVAAVVSGVPI